MAGKILLGAGVLPLACALWVWGCGDGDGPRAQCERICAKRELCDSATDEDGCIDRCRVETFRSQAYFQLRADCFDQLSCNELDEEADDCVEDALRREGPSELAVMVCQSLATKIEACQDEDAVELRRECEDGPALYMSERYLMESQSCVDMSCGEIEGCLESLADGYDTELILLDD